MLFLRLKNYHAIQRYLCNDTKRMPWTMPFAPTLEWRALGQEGKNPSETATGTDSNEAGQDPGFLPGRGTCLQR